MHGMWLDSERIVGHPENARAACGTRHRRSWQHWPPVLEGLPSEMPIVEGKNYLRCTADPIGCIALPGVQITLHIAVTHE
jgi:hypothetical protein